MRSHLAAISAAAALLASACGASDGESASEGELTPVSVGALPITAVAPLYLGVEQGIFEERGLDVTVETGGGGATTAPRVVSGELDFAFGNVVSLMIAREQGTDYSALVVPAGSEAAGAADLEGTTIAIDNLQNIGDTSVRNSVRVDGGDPEDIDFVETRFADSYPWQLSGGMQQRVAIARAIAYEPKVLLMDEPFAAVDAQTRADLEDLIRQIWHRFGVTVLFVTHDIDEVVYLGERVVVLSSSPTVVQDDITVDLPEERDQLTTRQDERFTELRTRVYAEIQQAKNNAGRTPEPAQG